MADIYTKLSQNYAKLGKRNETFASLKKALSHANCYDNLSEGQQYYTRIIVADFRTVNHDCRILTFDFSIEELLC
jgi:hypothetical protein